MKRQRCARAIRYRRVADVAPPDTGARQLSNALRNLLHRAGGGGVGAVLARGAGAFLAVHVLGIGIGFGVQVLLARVLGVEAYGVYVYAFSWMAFLLLLCRFGLGTSSLRFVSALRGAEDWGQLRGFLRFSWQVTLGGSLVVGIVTAAVVAGLAPRLSEPLVSAFWVVCLTLPFHALLQVWASSIRALKRVVASQVPSVIAQPLLLVLGIAAVLASGRTLAAHDALALSGAAAACALVASGLILRSALPGAVRAATPETRSREWLAVAAPLLTINLLNLTIQRADVLVVGSLLGPADAGLYAPARRVATIIGFGLVAVNAWAAPMIADLHNRGETRRLQGLVRRAAQIVFAATLPLTAGVLLLGRQILSAFGPEFPAAYPALAILAVGQLVNALAGPVGFLMTMTGHERTAVRILGVNAVLNLLLLVVLTPRFGLAGAAAASAAVNVTWNVAMAITVWRRLGLRATIV
jgi:O-antigen/teichoic acid export membrane protein